MNVLFVCATEKELATCLYDTTNKHVLLSTRQDIVRFLDVVDTLDKLLGRFEIDRWCCWDKGTQTQLNLWYSEYYILPDFCFQPFFSLKELWVKEYGCGKLKRVMLDCGYSEEAVKSLSPYNKTFIMITLMKFLNTEEIFNEVQAVS